MPANPKVSEQVLCGRSMYFMKENEISIKKPMPKTLVLAAEIHLSSTFEVCGASGRGKERVIRREGRQKHVKI